MRIIDFSKYHGTGNDFILIHDSENNLGLSPEVIQRMCSRRFGIGSDGLILIQSSNKADFHMEFYNPDASQSFCGNGSRCAVKYAHSLNLIGNSCTFSAIDGIHEAVIEEDQIAVRMGDVDKIESIGEDSYLHTGSPHYILWTQDLDNFDLIREAHKIRYSPNYAAEGVNVNVVERQSGQLKVRTYERGVEGETFSCGTGVTAVALADYFRHNGEQHREIETKGGVLVIHFDASGQTFTNIKMTGPAEFVYKGIFQFDV